MGLRFDDFKCPDCGAEEEILIAADREQELYPRCSVCGTEMQRQITVPSFHFKGHGWTGKIHHRGLRAEHKSAEDTLEEDSNGKLRRKQGVGHDA